MRHRSPVALRSQDIQIKLSSLRQQIWMGVTENIEKNIALPFVREPLSWGISNMALRQDKTDSEALLKRDMKKLQFFEYFTVKSNTKEVQNKYKHKKSIYSNDTNLGLENQLQSIEQKPKKKKVPLKWQKMTNSRMEEMRHGKTSFLTIKADSLKLVTLEMPSKVQTRQLKNEYKRKHRKSDSVSNGGKISTITKSEMHLQTHPRSHIQLQPLIVPLCDSFSSDDSANSHAQEILKKKCKKKKQSKKIKSTAVTGKKKRAISANTLRNA